MCPEWRSGVTDVEHRFVVFVVVVMSYPNDQSIYISFGVRRIKSHKYIRRVQRRTQTIQAIIQWMQINSALLSLSLSFKFPTPPMRDAESCLLTRARSLSESRKYLMGKWNEWIDNTTQPTMIKQGVIVGWFLKVERKVAANVDGNWVATSVGKTCFLCECLEFAPLWHRHHLSARSNLNRRPTQPNS